MSNFQPAPTESFTSTGVITLHTHTHNMYIMLSRNEKLFKENRFCRHIMSAENVFIAVFLQNFGLYGFLSHLFAFDEIIR